MVVALLWINGLGFLGFGIAGLFFPDVITGLTGLVASGGDAPIEIRAQYGGLFLAIGAFGVFGALNSQVKSGALLLVLMVYAGLALGRMVGLALDDGEPGSYTYGATGFEVVMTFILAGLYFTQPATQPLNQA